MVKTCQCCKEDFTQSKAFVISPKMRTPWHQLQSERGQKIIREYVKSRPTTLCLLYIYLSVERRPTQRQIERDHATVFIHSIFILYL